MRRSGATLNYELSLSLSSGPSAKSVRVAATDLVEGGLLGQSRVGRLGIGFTPLERLRVADRFIGERVVLLFLLVATRIGVCLCSTCSSCCI